VVNCPLVSVVTPFYNTAEWLSECIESVLGQTYANWEYILLDNCSTDGSTDVALRYAANDPRIRYVRNAELLPQVPNYNAALALISGESRYCKMVQADDWIFPECLESMVDVFEASDTIGLVAAYYVKGSNVLGSGLPYPSRRVSGKDVVRRLLREGTYVFGSPSAHMYRSSVIRAQQPFYDASRLHDDTEACVRMLETWDFGFVHQVLSFLRVHDDSITSRSQTFDPFFLDHYILVRRYAGRFLDAGEAQALDNRVRAFYYSFLARSVLERRSRDFWDYHREGLRTLGETIEWPVLLAHLAKKIAWLAVNPGRAYAVVFGSRNTADESNGF
jgi:glycosyltransferase involved in cell wall biosynthesis